MPSALSFGWWGCPGPCGLGFGEPCFQHSALVGGFVPALADWALESRAFSTQLWLVGLSQPLRTGLWRAVPSALSFGWWSCPGPCGPGFGEPCLQHSALVGGFVPALADWALESRAFSTLLWLV
ncbi:hypothetical protein P3T73_17850 [Kiritimatiellota bacterium B12222]|nr:hypothetical protein P3T73_17850 [Kiritimatiellota bacterium B12222]